MATYEQRLKGKKVAIFVDYQYEDLEIHFPLLRLQEEGATVLLIGQKKGEAYKGKYGYPAPSDHSIDDVNSTDFDALIIPGGFAPDYFRRNKKMVQFTVEMHNQGKPVAAICHGPWMLCSARILKGIKATSFIAVKDDVENAGAIWVDEPVVNDKNIITSRTPKDLIVFVHAIIDAILAKK